MKTHNSIKKLIISETRIKLINIFYSDINNVFYVRELVRATKEEINSIRRELENLRSANLIQSESRGNRLYYSVNKENFMTLDLMTIAHKNTNLGQYLQKEKSTVGEVDVLLYGLDYAIHAPPRSTESIDFIIVGDISIRHLEKFIKEEETRLGRELNYMVMDKNEFFIRRQKRDAFLVEFMVRSPLVILGNISVLNKI